MAVLLANNVVSTLAASVSDTDTVLTVATGTGSSFPEPSGVDYFYITLLSTSGLFEIAKVTFRSGDALTVERGQDNTTAIAFTAGARVEMRVNVASVQDYVTEYAASASLEQRYLGAQASDPTVRANGDPLQEGDFYYNTTDDVLRVYNGTAWQDSVPAQEQQYQGALASDPATRVGGGALQTGDFYYNTTDDVMRVWDSIDEAFADVVPVPEQYQGAQLSDPATRVSGDALQLGDFYFNATNSIFRVYNSTIPGWVDGAPSSETFAAWDLNDYVPNVVGVTDKWTFSDENRTFRHEGGGVVTIRSTKKDLKRGKWYWEVTVTESGSNSDAYYGVLARTSYIGQYIGFYGTSRGPLAAWRLQGAYHGGGATGPTQVGTPQNIGSTFPVTLNFALDLDNGAMWCGIEGVWNTAGADPATNTNPDFNNFPDLGVTQWALMFTNDNQTPDHQSTTNFGNTSFQYTPPSGFNAGIPGTMNEPPPAVLEEFTATAGQTVFTYERHAFVPGANNLSVFVNGVRQGPNAYTETADANIPNTGRSITFSSGLTVGDVVLLITG